jgi:hypothetical protein
MNQPRKQEQILPLLAFEEILLVRFGANNGKI